jgi:hypothetical protein
VSAEAIYSLLPIFYLNTRYKFINYIIAGSIIIIIIIIIISVENKISRNNSRKEGNNTVESTSANRQNYPQ